jgi:hypothetical protein
VKLDGDKLLADLDDILEHLGRVKTESVKQELWAGIIKLQSALELTNEIKGFIEDGKYTIKD